MAASLLVAFVVLEVALRFTHFRYLTHPPVAAPRGYYIADADFGADLAPNQPPGRFWMRGPAMDVFTNQWGCFDHDEPVEEGYLLAIGDSSTWGFAALEDKWTTHLEILSERRVLKCGVTDTGTKHQIGKAHKTIARVGVSPASILVLYDWGNDLNDDVVFPNHDVVGGIRGHTLKSLDLRTGELARLTREEFETKYRQLRREYETFDLVRHLRTNLTTVATFLHYCERLALRILGPSDHSPILEHSSEVPLWRVDTDRYPWVLEAYEEHLQTLRSLHDLAADYDAELVFITDKIPSDGLRTQLREFVSAEFPYHVDVGPPMQERAQGRRVRYHHNSHWNALGNRLAGEIIHEYLSEAGLL